MTIKKQTDKIFMTVIPQNYGEQSEPEFMRNPVWLNYQVKPDSGSRTLHVLGRNDSPDDLCYRNYNL